MVRTRRLVQLAVILAVVGVCGTAWSAQKTYVVRANEGWSQIAKSHNVTTHAKRAPTAAKPQPKH